jgi:hypothetical protein
MYLDKWEYGQYEDWVLKCSTPARTYESQVIEVIAKSLNEQLVHLLLPREPMSLPSFSTPNATDHGASSSARTWAPRKPSTKSTPRFWESWLRKSSSRKVDSPGLLSRK